MKLIALALLVLFCFAAVPVLAFDAVLKRVIDGDTLDVLTLEGEVRRVRLIGASAPEPTNVVPCAKYWAGQATTALTELVAGQSLWVALDMEQKDRYGRWLGYIWAGDVLVNAVLIEQGLAWAGASGKNLTYRSLFEELEAKARSQRRGIWAWPMPAK